VGLKGDLAVRWIDGACPVGVGGKLFISPPGDPASARSFEISAIRRQGRSCVVRLEGVRDRRAAEALCRMAVYVDEADLSPLKENEYYCRDIVGLSVHLEDGRRLGTVARVYDNGAHDIYEVRGDGGSEILIPAVDAFILSIDLEGRRMTVRLLEGMEG